MYFDNTVDVNSMVPKTIVMLLYYISAKRLVFNFFKYSSIRIIVIFTVTPLHWLHVVSYEVLQTVKCVNFSNTNLCNCINRYCVNFKRQNIIYYFMLLLCVWNLVEKKWSYDIFLFWMLNQKLLYYSSWLYAILESWYNI